MATYNGSERLYSVTRDDVPETAGALPSSFPSGYTYFLVPQQIAKIQGAMGVPPYYSVAGDYFLRATILMENMWAGAIARGITSVSSKSWLVEDQYDSQRNTRVAQELLNHAEAGDGWSELITKLLLDFWLTDNGAFMEIEREKGAVGGRVRGLYHLDSTRCRRTGRTDYPVVYTDLSGKDHALAWWQVIAFSDMSHTDARMFGVGYCAARRSVETIILLAGLTGHASERVLGAGNTAIHFVRGVHQKTLEAAFRDGDQLNLQKGRLYYKGALIIPMIDPTQPIELVTVPLSGLPENWNAEQIRSNGYLVYANNLGIPLTDIQPLSGQGLGTGEQSRVIDERAKGIGVASFLKSLSRIFNSSRWQILPRTTRFVWDEDDIRDAQAQAAVQQTRASTRAAMVKSGEITPLQSLQLAVDAGDVPASFLPQGDQTPGGQLADEEKPILSSPGVQPSEPGQNMAASDQETPLRSPAGVSAAVQDTSTKKQIAGSSSLIEKYNPHHDSRGRFAPLGDRTFIPAPGPDRIALIVENVRRRLTEQAATFDRNVADLENTTLFFLDRWASESDICIRVPPGLILDILKDGYQNNPVSEASSESNLTVESSDIRAETERKTLGISPGAPLSSYPVYGYLEHPTSLYDGRGGNATAARYGGAKLYLSSEVKNRSTLGMGNVLYSGWADTMAPARLGQATVGAIGLARVTEIRADRSTYENMQAMGDEIIEVQIYGGIDAGNIRYVGFDDRPLPEVQDALRAFDIPWGSNYSGDAWGTRK